MYGHTRLGGFVHIGAYLGDLPTLHGKFSQVKPGLLTAFDGAQAQSFILLDIVIRNAHKNEAEGAVFTEVSELLK